MLPNALIARAYVARGARIWLGARAILMVILWLGQSDLKLSLLASIQVVALSIALSFIDTHRHRERALLGNLGMQPVTVDALFGLPALLGEMMLRALLRA